MLATIYSNIKLSKEFSNTFQTLEHHNIIVCLVYTLRDVTQKHKDKHTVRNIVAVSKMIKCYHIRKIIKHLCYII